MSIKHAYVPNKYHLTYSDIIHFHVQIPEALKKPPFWRNDVVKAWCLSGTTAKNKKDEMYGCYAEYWIGFKDNGRIEVDLVTESGMCSYHFKKFYDPKDIDNDQQLELQEILLERLNWLMDNFIVAKSPR